MVGLRKRRQNPRVLREGRAAVGRVVVDLVGGGGGSRWSRGRRPRLARIRSWRREGRKRKGRGGSGCRRGGF